MEAINGHVASQRNTPNRTIPNRTIRNRPFLLQYHPPISRKTIPKNHSHVARTMYRDGAEQAVYSTAQRRPNTSNLKPKLRYFRLKQPKG